MAIKGQKNGPTQPLGTPAAALGGTGASKEILPVAKTPSDPDTPGSQRVAPTLNETRAESASIQKIQDEATKSLEQTSIIRDLTGETTRLSRSLNMTRTLALIPSSLAIAGLATAIIFVNKSKGQTYCDNAAATLIKGKSSGQGFTIDELEDIGSRCEDSEAIQALIASAKSFKSTVAPSSQSTGLTPAPTAITPEPSATSFPKK